MYQNYYVFKGYDYAGYSVIIQGPIPGGLRKAGRYPFRVPGAAGPCGRRPSYEVLSRPSVLALSAGSCEAMRNLFTAGLVRKEYLAVIENSPPESSGEYTDLLFHDSRKNKSFVVSRNRKGVRDALCSWNVMESIHDNDRILTLVHITLHTGRTHQIRVQFASRGYPLAGDRKYGSRVKADTVCLWASGISFPHPLERHGHIVSALSMPPSLFPWNRFGPLTYSPEDG